jgi:plastocyanin
MLDSQSGWIVGSDGLILFTNNGGSTWTTQLSVPVPGPSEDEFEGIHAIDAQHAWAVGGTGRIYATADGANWTPQTSGTTVALMDVWFTSAASGWHCGAGGWLSEAMSGGELWHTQIPPSSATFNSVYFVGQELGFLAGSDGKLYILGTPLPPVDHTISIANFAFDPQTLQIEVGDVARWVNNDNVAHTATADNGEFNSGTLNPGEHFDFMFMTDNVEIPYHCAIHPAMTGMITVGAPLTDVTHTINILNFAFDPAELTINAGDTVRWVNSDEVPHTATADNGEFDSGTLNQGDHFDFIFTDENLWIPYHCELHPAMTGSILVGDTTSSAAGDDPLLAGRFELSQAYPNPFNPSTTLSLQNPRLQQVTLAVYDLLGRQVSLLVDAPLAAGTHEFSFNAAGLATGLYFARARAGDVTHVRKLTLIK